MTSNRPIRRSHSPLPQTTASETPQKPYALVQLPKHKPDRAHPVGQHRLNPERFSGKISLRLTVQTVTFVASGVTALGSDISSQTKGIPLIKTTVQRDQHLIIPGSSLKGVVRSIYEALTRSCLCKTKADRSRIPDGYIECRERASVCPACQVFGAMGWQGLIRLSDAVGTEITNSIGFMPSLYAPRSQRYYRNGMVAGRKFYYHTVRAVEEGEQRGIPVQQAGTAFVFTTELRFMNLSQAELGTLLTVLGQDEKNFLALKVGGGKPIGMGTMTVEVAEIECPKNLRNRYAAYQTAEADHLTGNALKQFMQTAIAAAHHSLIQAEQLQQLKAILQYPTDRQPIEGMY